MEIANLQCPFCGSINRVEVPQKTCLVMHKCQACNRLITLKEGSCCVICAYSDKMCPVSSKEVK